MAKKNWRILIVFKMNVKDYSAIETVHKDDTVLIYDAITPLNRCYALLDATMKHHRTMWDIP